MSRDPRTRAEPLGFTRFALLLHSIPHIGEKTLTRLLHHVTSRRIDPDTCLQWSVEEWQARCELDARAATMLCQQQDALLAQTEELARTVRQHHLHVLTLQSPAYPDRLERFDDAPPPIVYALGNLGLLLPSARSEPQTASAPLTFSIAVSNGADNATLKRLDEMAAELVRRGCIPVTGHDRTPYKRLALAAQRQNRSTIYVLDRGLRDALGPAFDRPPFAAARIRETVFDTSRDLALSPFRLDDHALGANLRRRDRMLYALCDLIIALDVRAGGGMEAECKRAQAQGRMVWVAGGGRDGNAALREAGCTPLPEGIGNC